MVQQITFSSVAVLQMAFLLNWSTDFAVAQFGGLKANEDFLWVVPHELRFSDAGAGDQKEDLYAKRLAKGNAKARVTAAAALWSGHSRTHAKSVVEFLAKDGIISDEFLALRKRVEDDLSPKAILIGLETDDPRWAAWRAGLRPHAELVPALLAALKDKPKYRPEITLALGQSRDKRAFAPLAEMLKSDGNRSAGDAAHALGLLGNSEAEPLLIQSLSNGGGWVKLQASIALGKIGTDAAIPELERIVKSDENFSLLGGKVCAREAIKEITKRQKR